MSPNGNYTMTDKLGKMRASKVCDSQVKKYFEKELIEPTIPSELTQAPKDIPPTSPLPLAEQALSLTIE